MKHPRLRIAACVGALGLALPLWAPEAAHQVIANSFGFSVDISGVAEASDHIRDVSIDELKIDAREVPGVDADYRIYEPGAARFGQARLGFRCSPEGCRKLGKWADRAEQGREHRKNITVTLFNSAKAPGRIYELLACTPVDFKHDVRNDEAKLPCVLTVQIGSIRFGSPDEDDDDAAPAPAADAPDPAPGILVEISGPGKSIHRDLAWERVSGGDLNIEMTGTAAGKDPHLSHEPGAKSFEDLTLVGPLTSGRGGMCRWFNATIRGGRWQRKVAITDQRTKGKVFVFADCFPIEYVFPRLSVSDTAGNVMEEISVKPLRGFEEPGKPRGAVLVIPDAPLASAGARRITIRELDLDVRRDPGKPPPCGPLPRAVIVVEAGPNGTELAEWFRDPKPRNLIIEFHSASGDEVRRWNLMESFPVKFSPGEYSPSSETKVETIVVQIGKVELA